MVTPPALPDYRHHQAAHRRNRGPKDESLPERLPGLRLGPTDRPTPLLATLATTGDPRIAGAALAAILVEGSPASLTLFQVQGIEVLADRTKIGVSRAKDRPIGPGGLGRDSTLRLAPGLFLTLS
jgi:hypothetical protein